MTSLRLEFLVAACLLGAATGLFIGFVIMMVGFGGGMQPVGIIFQAWILEPQIYWPWPVLGAVIGALIFWVGALIRGH
jgi:hypothetical protein